MISRILKTLSYSNPPYYFGSYYSHRFLHTRTLHHGLSGSGGTSLLVLVAINLERFPLHYYQKRTFSTTPKLKFSNNKDSKKTTDEKSPKISSDEKSPKISSDEKSPKISSEEKSPKIFSDEKSPKISSDEKSPKISSDEKSPKISSDEKSPKISSDEKSPKISSDEKSPKISSEEKSPKISSDEKSPKISTNEKSTEEKSTNEKEPEWTFMSLLRYPPALFTKEDAQNLVKEVSRVGRTNRTILKVVLGVVVIVVLAVALFWDQIQKFLGKQTAQVATWGLEDEMVQFKVKDFSKAFLKELMNHYSQDEETKTVIVEFIKSILEDPQTVVSVVGLVSEVMADPLFRTTATHLAKDVVVQVLNDPAVILQFVKTMEILLAMEETQLVLVQLFTKLFHDPYIISELDKLIALVLAGDHVAAQVDEISENIAISLMKDPALIAQAQEFLKSTVNDSNVQETVGNALWECLKIALIPTILRTKQYTPESEESTTTPTELEFPKKEEELLHVPEHKVQGIAEIIFRECYEKISKKWGLQYTPEGLSGKKRDFEEELENWKKNLSPSLQRNFGKIIQKYFDSMFLQDQELIDAGGEEALVVRAKERINKKIQVYKEYLDNMEKLEKGYFWNVYTPQQMEDRKVVMGRISALEMEKTNPLVLLEKELDGIMSKSPLVLLRKGTVEEYLKSEERG